MLSDALGSPAEVSTLPARNSFLMARLGPTVVVHSIKRLALAVVGAVLLALHSGKLHHHGHALR